MKRKMIFIFLSIGLVTAVFAQGWDQRRIIPDDGNRPDRPERLRPEQNRPAVEAVTVSGSMIVAHGFPAVKSGDVTYIMSGINRLIGFVDGLKEGAQVTVEGSAFSLRHEENVKFLRPLKLTLSGKIYDLSFPELGIRRFNFDMRNMPRRHNMNVPKFRNRNFNNRPGLPGPRPVPRRQAPQMEQL